MFPSAAHNAAARIYSPVHVIAPPRYDAVDVLLSGVHKNGVLEPLA